MNVVEERISHADASKSNINGDVHQRAAEKQE
jgi:hypothetical protein